MEIVSRFVFSPTTVLLYFILVCSSSPMMSISAIRDTVTLTTNTDFIKTSCSKTTYPQLCITSLSSYASAIQTSPKLLALEALNVTLAKARSVSSFITKLSKITDLKPREAQAIADCAQELDDSVFNIERSIDEMNGPKSSNDFQLMISDIETWVSAALTDDMTCSDGFSGEAMDGKLKTVVRNRMGEISQMTSNALALINLYANSN